MYGYEEHIEVTPEQILQKITQEQIFEFILGVPFNINNRYTSPLREDNKPGCRFEQRQDGTILFVDFGERLLTGHTHRTCFSMVMDFFGVNLDGAIRKICIQFSLSNNVSDYKPVDNDSYRGRVSYEQQTDRQNSTILGYHPKSPTKSDVWYWSQFLIKVDELKEDNVFCVNRFTIKNHKGYRVIPIYKYCYVFDFIDRMKIYQPFSEKYRWITNCDENNIGNIDNLPYKGKELIIQKSYKDHRVLRNIGLGLNVIWFQNEGCVPSLEILKNLTQRFELITIFFDNDEDGTLAAIKLCNIFNQLREDCARIVHLPTFISRKLTHKDPSTFINKEGKTDLITILNQIGIYGKDS